MITGIPAEIVAYLTARDRERAQRVDGALAALTPREQRLVREAAVMGYVQGARAERGEKIPPDLAIQIYDEIIRRESR